MGETTSPEQQTGADKAQKAPRAAFGQMEVVAVVLLVVVFGGQFVAPYLDSPQFSTWSTIFLAIVIQSTPFLVLGVALSAIISIVLSERVLQKVVPRNNVLAVPVAGVAGVGLPGCECAAVPIAGSLIRRGIAPAVALTFLLAAPAVNPAVIVSTAVAFPGEYDIVAARFIASLLTAVLVGWWCLSRGSRLPLRRLEHPRPGPLADFRVAVERARDRRLRKSQDVGELLEVHDGTVQSCQSALENGIGAGPANRHSGTAI